MSQPEYSTRINFNICQFLKGLMTRTEVIAMFFMGGGKGIRLCMLNLP
jgi:hypothetical protein